MKEGIVMTERIDLSDIWGKLTEDDKTSIGYILKRNDLMSENDVLTETMIEPTCEEKCEIKLAAAIAACAALPYPADVACIAAAGRAHERCMDACEE